MDLAGLTGLALYVVLFVVVFVESGILIGFWLPGDTILFAAGLLAADPDNRVSVAVLAAGVTFAAVAGAFVGYATGARLGRSYLERRYGGLLGRAETFYRRYGTATLVAARFVPWLRTFAPVMAGAVAMPKLAFARAVAAGALVWGTGLVLLGYGAAEIPGLRSTPRGWRARSSWVPSLPARQSSGFVAVRCHGATTDVVVRDNRHQPDRFGQ